MQKNLLAAFLAAFSLSAYAAPETFVIESSHTAPRFEYNHLGFSNQIHRFDQTSGQITLDRVSKTASVDVSIDVSSVNTGMAVFNQHIQGEDFFDAAKYPKITFKSRSVKFEGDKPVSLEGDLTIKGVTRPVTLAVKSFLLKPHPMTKKEALGANAEAKIKRSDFNISKYTPSVSDEVTLSIAVEAMKQ